MASAVQSMRLCLRAASRRTITTPTAAAAIPPRQHSLALRSFSSTSFQRRPASNKDDVDELEGDIQEIDESEEVDPAVYERALAELQRDPSFERATRSQERAVNNMGEVMSEAMRTPRFTNRLFWGDEEPDHDLLSDELDVDKFDEDDIMAMAHGKFEEFREYREYARIAAWQMPLLSSKDFSCPTSVP